MAKLAKTPDELYKGAEIKPDAAVDNEVGDIRINVRTIPGMPYPSTQQLPYGGRKVQPLFYGSAESKAQAVANKYQKPTAYREEDQFGPTRTSLYPGKRGLKLPEQWKYKRADQLADKMISGFEGDPTAGMSRDDYIEHLQNEKGWDRDAALRHADLFFGKK